MAEQMMIHIALSEKAFHCKVLASHMEGVARAVSSMSKFKCNTYTK